MIHQLREAPSTHGSWYRTGMEEGSEDLRAYTVRATSADAGVEGTYMVATLKQMVPAAPPVRSAKDSCFKLDRASNTSR